MKKIIIAVLIVLTYGSMAYAQEEGNAVRVPSGYQGFLEHGTLFRAADKWATSICVSTTHGFYYGGNTYIGIGVSLEGDENYFAMPIYTALKYNFGYTHQVTPTLQVRVGSYLSEHVGAYCDLAFGVRFGSSRDFAINVLGFGTFYSKYKSEPGIYDDVTKTYTVTVFNPSGIGLRIGIEW